METVKALALAVAIGFPLLVLLSMLMGLLIRTQHKWRKLPQPAISQPIASWQSVSK
jgi:hypothetical protein